MAEQSDNKPTGLGRITYIVAIGSGKGGVGKSTVAVNLATALAAKGLKVGLMDADIYGPSQPGMLGSHGEEPDVSRGYIEPLVRHGIKFVSMGLFVPDDGPVIWRAPMATKMIQEFINSVAWGELDYLLIDLPPGTGDVQLTLSQQAHLSGAIIITTPQQVAQNVADKGLRMFAQVNVPIYGIVENMSGFICAHCGKETRIFKGEGGRELAERHQVSFLGALPLDPQIVESGDQGRPLLSLTDESPAAQALLSLADAVHKQVQNVEKEISANEPKEYHLDDQGVLHITWPDNTETVHTPRHLRINSHSAENRDERTGELLIDPNSVPVDITITKMRPVGRYGLALHFSDGHTTGIYAYTRLRSLDESQNKSESFSV
jgi:ATP-binding protein involved in chromosome partitioning